MLPYQRNYKFLYIYFVEDSAVQFLLIFQVDYIVSETTATSKIKICIRTVKSANYICPSI